MTKEVSSCCGASIRVEGDSFGEGTNCYICMRCGKPCDAEKSSEDDLR